MLYVIGCITQQHDLRLVLLAGLLCLFACATAMGMILRARGAVARMRAFWLGAAGTVAGGGIWGTHFVAMLAFRPGLPVGYSGGLTFLSVVIAASLSSVGFALALRPRCALLGGALTGAAISAMHYAGMAAVRIPADAHWQRSYVIASVLIGVVLSAAAMRVALKSRTIPGYSLAVILFTLAICGMHFTGMAAVTYVPNPLLEIPDAVLDPIALAMAVAAGAILIVALGLVGVIVDNHLAGRSVEESRRLRAYVQELEATKAKLEATSANLSAALLSAGAANKAKSEFLASVSHELRTPLNAVIGFSEVILKEMFGPIGNPRYRDYIRDINASGSHLLGLINDVLDISRLDAGELQLAEDEIDVGGLCAETMRIMAPQAEAANVKLQCSAAPNLPALRVDPRRLRQILFNLLANAVKFTPALGSVQLTAEERPNGFAFVVSDTGIGMTSDEITKALERFGQVDSRLSRKYDGVGLGLPLAKQLAEFHGGSLEVESTPGVGTEVTVLLPRERIMVASKAA